MRIDAHQHFWRYSPATHGWIDDTMAALKRNFLPGDLAPILRANSIDGCVAVQAEQSIAETEWLLSLAAEHPFIRGVVGWVDLCADDVREQLRAISANPLLRGIRHFVQSEPDDRFMLRPDFTRGIAALAEFGLTYDILIVARQMPAAIDLVAAFPEQRFVLDHIGKPDIRGGEIDAWARGIAALARNRNVWCKLSGIVTEAEWSSWTADDIMPYVRTVFEWFAPNRIMFGSDWPVCTLAAPYDAVAQIAQDAIAMLTDRDQDAIRGGNAAQFYGLR